MQTVSFCCFHRCQVLPFQGLWSNLVFDGLSADRKPPVGNPESTRTIFRGLASPPPPLEAPRKPQATSPVIRPPCPSRSCRASWSLWTSAPRTFGPSSCHSAKQPAAKSPAPPPLFAFISPFVSLCVPSFQCHSSLSCPFIRGPLSPGYFSVLPFSALFCFRCFNCNNQKAGVACKRE